MIYFFQNLLGNIAAPTTLVFLLTLGEEIYKREENWTNLRKNYIIFESTVTDKKKWVDD